MQNNFAPEINKIIILDAKRGMGKTTLINYLINKVHHISYRGSNYWQLFKDIMLDQQIQIVQLSLLPFMSALPVKDPKIKSNYENCSIKDKIEVMHEEHATVKQLIQYIADNLDTNSAKILKKLAKTIDSVNYKGITLKDFNTLFTSNDTLDALRNKLRKSERKVLLILEDMDRLNEYQLPIIAEFLWFIHGLPFTITLIPCEKDKLYNAVNIFPTDTAYEELEQHKLFQFDFPITDYVYDSLASTLLHRTTIISKNSICAINNSYLHLYQLTKKLGDDSLFENLLKEVHANDWETLLITRLKDAYSHLNSVVQQLLNSNDLSFKSLQSSGLSNYEQELIRNSGIFNETSSIDIVETLSNRKHLIYRQASSHGYVGAKLWDSIKNDIVNVLKSHDVSLREFKYITKKLRLGGGYIFIVQQIIFHILKSPIVN